MAGHKNFAGTYSSVFLQLECILSLKTMFCSNFHENRKHVKILNHHCRPQGIGGFGSDERNLGFLNATQRPARGQPASNPPNSFPTMGPNPFG